MKTLFKNFLLAFLVGFTTIGAMSFVFGEAVQSTFFPEFAAASPNFALLTGGVALTSFLIAILYPRLGISKDSDWLASALKVGLVVGLLSFFATHLTQAGYLNVSTTGWLLEGLYDSLAPFFSIVAIAFASRNRLGKASRNKLGKS